MNNPGMYEPSFEHDACGLGFVADLSGSKSRTIINMGLDMLLNLNHRGAVGADEFTGDGAGITIQMPDNFIRKVCFREGIILPDSGRYAVGMLFLPQNSVLRKACHTIIEKIIDDEEQIFLGWRNVPVNPNVPGKASKLMMPFIRQCFIQANDNISSQEEFERKLFLIRRIIDHRIRTELKCDRSKYYVPSFSSRIIIYKGMLLANQLPEFYSDLRDQDLQSAFAVIHLRFSTNTFPTWDLAHPFRMIAHNGEINTLRGNKNWMAAREAVMESEYYGKDLKRMLPIIMEGQSDSATFDTVLELLVLSGRSLPHAVMMMIPEAWSKNDKMDENLKAFYEYHATFMEPWDGPAAVVFTDGNLIGASLDRNGLRPARYMLTNDNLVILCSESGVLNIPEESIIKKGMLQPGKMFLVNLSKGKLLHDLDVKDEVVNKKPYHEWVKNNILTIDELPSPLFKNETDHQEIFCLQKTFGYTSEDLNIVMMPMIEFSEEAVGSMGNDASLAVLSEKPQLLFRYFKQLFAQVTNPPIDPIREQLVMELTTYIGPEQNLLSETPQHAHRIELKNPLLSNSEFEKLKALSTGHFRSLTISILFDNRKRHNMRERLDEVCDLSVEAVKNGFSLLILSDKGSDEFLTPIPSLLAVSAVHHSLIKNGLRTKTGIIIQSGEPREVSHFALLCGYGANAINPYLAYDTIKDMYNRGQISSVLSYKDAKKNFVKAVSKGLFKIFSKMGISTLQSYCGAQIFEIIGLDSELVSKYFTGTPSKIEGLSLEMLEEETLKRHRMAYDESNKSEILNNFGLYQYRKDGEHHWGNPLTISKLQQSTRNNEYKTFKEYSDLINSQDKKRVTIRSLLQFQKPNEPIPLSEVEVAKEIVKRFSTGAMSFGSISWEVHTSLALAMNKIGGKSNTGEGGESSERFKVRDNGESIRSAIKQVASARFGVTANYLVNADDLQIKISQGAKPGEGGQLPGFKVDEIIAKVRHSTPGVTLISPPPHHDIYSIEDLKQLIFDLKNINPKARVSVKLVSEVGVGTIAAGVAKAKADHILISGHDGGTGASPISSIQYAGTPWELGLSETHQTLVLNGLRDRVYLAVDGQLKTGRDVVIAALLGAEEFGFATAPLVTQGCIMMRKCHLNTCPVGVATQDPELRRRFTGKPEYLINFMFFIAEEVREIMSQFGFRKFEDMVGRVDKIEQIKSAPKLKYKGIDLSKLLFKQEPLFDTDQFRTKSQDHKLEDQLDKKILMKIGDAIENGRLVKLKTKINNTDLTVGALISNKITSLYGDKGLSEGSVKIELQGTAGQSFGAFLSKGIELKIYGEANDYVGKGLSGGRIIVRLPNESNLISNENIIVGNTCLYGATGGEAFINGIAGERFAVRNSGADAVVEGLGDHGCEYMTGGIVIVLGNIGRNFGAGMSGGIAYLWNCTDDTIININSQLVEVDKLKTDDDVFKVFSLIEKHFYYTNSKRAKFILQNWAIEKLNFTKVISLEYKKALEKRNEGNYSRNVEKLSLEEM